MPVTRQLNENKVAHAMSTHSRLVFDASGTSPWRHKMKIKDLFVDESTHETVDALLRHVVLKLRMVIESENHRRDHKNDDERAYFIQKLENLKDDFDANIGAGEDETIEERVKQFDYMLSELYDIGDMKIELRDGKLQKFMWVG